MQACNYCKVEKDESNFLTIRGRKTKNCQRCRNRENHRIRNKFHRNCNICLTNKEEKIEKIEEKMPNNLIEEPCLTDLSISEYIEFKKNELKPLLCRYSKQKILNFFENCEPNLSQALNYIESEELKNLIKIYMNSLYLESLK